MKIALFIVITLLLRISVVAADYYINTGCSGDGVTDDSACIQSNIDAAPNYSLIVWPSNFKAAVANSIEISNRIGIVIATPNRRASNEDGGSAPGMKWIGKDGGTVIKFNRARYCSLIGIAINASPDVEHYANIAIDIDGYLPGSISTQNEVGFCYIVNAGVTNQDFVGVRISGTAQSNNEFMSIHDNYIKAGEGIGILNGESSNAKNQYFLHNTIEHARIAIQMLNGSMRVEDLRGGDNDIDVQLKNGTEPIVLDNINTEHSRQGIVLIDAVGAGIKIVNCRADNSAQLPTAAYYDFGQEIPQQSIILENSVFESLPPSGQTVVNWGHVRSFVSRGNYWHPGAGMTEAQSGFDAVYYGTDGTSENECYLDRIPSIRNFGIYSNFELRGQTYSWLINRTSGIRDGNVMFCTDGVPGSSPLAAGGTGCFIVRQNGAWVGK